MEKIASIDHLLTNFERVLNIIAAVIMFATMCIVVVDVFLRYFFNSPLSWSYELIGLYFMVGLFFFCLSPTLSANAHVAVDLLQGKMSDRVRHSCDGIGYTLATIVFCGIIFMAYQRTLTSYINNDVIAGEIPWPTWAAHIMVLIGAVAMTLRMLFRAIGHLSSALLNKTIISLPPLAGSGEED